MSQCPLMLWPTWICIDGSKNVLFWCLIYAEVSDLLHQGSSWTCHTCATWTSSRWIQKLCHTCIAFLFPTAHFHGNKSGNTFLTLLSRCTIFLFFHSHLRYALQRTVFSFFLLSRFPIFSLYFSQDKVIIVNHQRPQKWNQNEFLRQRTLIIEWSQEPFEWKDLLEIILLPEEHFFFFIENDLLFPQDTKSVALVKMITTLCWIKVTSEYAVFFFFF